MTKMDELEKEMEIWDALPRWKKFVKDLPRKIRYDLPHYHRDVWWEIKTFYQRGRRGWGDRDVWGLDHYLSKVIPEALEHLKKTGHGHPELLSDEERNDPNWDPSSNDFQEKHKNDSEIWDGYLDEMIFGFKSMNHTLDCCDRRCPDMGMDYKLNHKKQEAEWKRGMELFTEYFGALWD